MSRLMIIACAACVATTATAQPTQSARPRAVNHTEYSANAELFAEWVPTLSTVSVIVTFPSTNRHSDEDGNGRIVIQIAAGQERFVIDNVPIYDSVEAALAAQAPAATGLVSYAKERSWDADFATAPVSASTRAGSSAVTVPSSAIVRDGETPRVYVQRTPERFELREVKTGRTIGDGVEVLGGLRAGERIVIRGAEKMPRS